MATVRSIEKALIAANGGALLANKAKISELTGLSPRRVYDITAQLIPVGGPKTFYLGDVAEALFKEA